MKRAFPWDEHMIVGFDLMVAVACHAQSRIAPSPAN